MPVYLLDRRLEFPPAQVATPEGLLAVGGDLSARRLVLAYRRGIFPWYSAGEPILWWSPDPRFVLYPAKLRVTRSMERIMRSGRFRITFDEAFEAVVAGCRDAKRRDETGTWITDAMLEAYCALHRAGYAHSVETWSEDTLVGGLYGVAVGRCFSGESMFARVSNASKAALIRLVERLRQWRFTLIDCQVHTDHLASMGAEAIPRARFLAELSETLRHPAPRGRWNIAQPVGPLEGEIHQTGKDPNPM
jgi:leucyl/phenylalanyl-tRNA--protein transferase